MGKVVLKPRRPIYPTPAALITSVAPDGRPNIITLGEVYNLSLANPTIVGVGIRKARYSHELISASREYVVNMPTTSMWEVVDLCGGVSGREVDKFTEFGLTPLPASVVRPPLIAECPINLECRVVGIEEIGDHDAFQGEVVAAHVDSHLLDDEGRLRMDQLDVLCFVSNFNARRGGYWSLGRRLGDAHSRRTKVDRP
jgi:flavin reductase (DIM6/NTAB) family NADH-FMN oxidoreductase RutF